MSSQIKEKIKKLGFYYYMKRDRLGKQIEPRMDCIGKKCPNWHASGGTVFCDEYVSGWCKGYCGYGKPHDELLIEVSKVLELLEELEK